MKPNKFLLIFSTVLTPVIFVSQSFSFEAVSWTQIQNVTATGSTIEKTGGSNQVADAGAISQQQITSGDGYIEFTVPANLEMRVGLGNEVSNSTTTAEILYSFQFNGASDWEIWHENSWENGGTFSSGSVFKIELVGNDIVYSVNGNSIGNPLTISNLSYPLVFDTALMGSGSKISNSQIVASNSPPSSGSCVPNLKADLGVYPEPSLPQLPAAGGKFCDPTFGTEIMRVTDETDGTSFGTEYSNVASFNSDSTQLFVLDVLNGSGFVVDFDPVSFTLGTDKRSLTSINGGGVSGSFVVWSETNKNILYATALQGGGPIIYEVNVDPDPNTVGEPMTKSVLVDFAAEGFPNVSSSDYLWQMTTSEDDNRFAGTRRAANGERVGFFVYDRPSQTLVVNETLPFMNNTSYDEVQIEKTGQFLLMKIPVDEQSESFVLDIDNDILTALTDGAPDYGPGHSDNGRGFVIGEENHDNSVLRRDFSDPHNFTVVLERPNIRIQSHISMRANDDNWSLISHYMNSSLVVDGVLNCYFDRNVPLGNELVRARTDGNGFWRIVHHRSVTDQCVNDTQTIGEQYDHTPRANISKDGRFVAFTSSWGTIGSGARQDLFVVRVPRTQFDYDGDGKADVSVYRPNDFTWYLNQSSFGHRQYPLGNADSEIAPADFDGDGITDLAVWNSVSGFWSILESSTETVVSLQFGATGDIPVQADYDGDGKADYAVWRPNSSANSGTWYLQQSTDGFSAEQFGNATDRPTVGDFDGDGKSDKAIFRPSNGQWWLNQSTNGVTVYQFGVGTDKTVQADYTGDGKTDVAVFRPSTGEWFVLRSEDNSFYGFPFGTTDDLPAPADYDGDGQYDAAVFRPGTGVWYLLQSSEGFSAVPYGTNGDIPTPSVYVE